MLSRARWLRIHRIVGLGSAAFLFVQAVTGAMLLYVGPLSLLIDPAGMKSRASGPVITAGAGMERAEDAMPGFRAVRIMAPASEQATWFVHLRDDAGESRYASVDPAGGAVLRAGGLAQFPVEAALQIHYRLAQGKAGMMVVALNGLALLFMAVSGLAYWWPERLAKALAIRWTMAPRLVLRQAHRTLGVVVAVVLIGMAGTGLALIVPEVADSAPAELPAVISGSSLDRGIARAQAMFPSSALRDARVVGERLIVNFHAPERNSRAVHRVVVTAGDAQVLSATPARQSSALWMTVLPVHAGDVIGPIGPAVLLLIAVALAGLAVTGPVMWWQATLQRGRSVRKGST